MNIGIGITTYKRPECLAKCLEQIKKHTDMKNVTLVIATDTDQHRKGIAYRKNECLRALQHCDHIFLFDDDCWPIKDGWVDYHIIQGFRGHLLFMNKKHHRLLSSERLPVLRFADCGGPFIYVNRKTLKQVGAFNEDFDTWGFEHAEWSNRIEGGRNSYYMAKNTPDYIYSADYSNNEHKSSIGDFEKEKYFQINKIQYNKIINKIYIPL